jgi:soluble cytochrome b562
MASSVTDAGNPQQGGKKNKEKKELASLVDDKLAEINHSVSTLTGRVEDVEKRIEELESTGDMEEFCLEMQEAVKSLASNVDDEVRALRDGELQACKAEI